MNQTEVLIEIKRLGELKRDLEKSYVDDVSTQDLHIVRKELDKAYERYLDNAMQEAKVLLRKFEEESKAKEKGGF